MISKKDLNILDGGREKEKGELSAIDLLAIDHERQLGICDVLLNSTKAMMEEGNTALLTSISCFFNDELPRHTQDEEGGLFPLLKSRCHRDAQALAVIERFQSEHKHDAEIVAHICAGLAALENGDEVLEAEEFIVNMCVFAAIFRRHIEWENLILLPMARTKLLSEDLRILQKKFIESRWTKTTKQSK